MFKCTPQHTSPVTIVDFGFARFATEDDGISTPCGTPGYIGMQDSELY